MLKDQMIIVKNINFLNINNCFLKFQLLFVFWSVGLGVNEGSILIEIKTIHEQCYPLKFSSLRRPCYLVLM